MNFPILAKSVHGKRLAYLDSAASAQKPAAVIEGEKQFYETSYANVHRGVHTLAEEATAAYELARKRVATLVNATTEELIFTSGTTASINLVANALAPTIKGDIVLSIMEHHSNFVPWQQLAKRYNVQLKIIPITPDYQLDMDAARQLITKETSVVALTHMSNVLGTINPIKELAALAHANDALLVVDGAQALPHMHVNVKDLDVDFYAFSGHKMYGPSGIGALYGKKALLQHMQPPVWGGEMVKEVTVEETTWNDLPWKFEPGTPNIAGAVGFGIAASFLAEHYEQIAQQEKELLPYMLEQLHNVEGLSLIGVTDAHRGGAFSFTFADVHPHDVSTILDQEGVAVRAGHHCTQPLHCALGLDATTRASLGIYNTKEDVDALVHGLQRVREVFK